MSIQHHYADASGNHFVAEFADDVSADAYIPPAGAVAIDPPPADGYGWNGSAWVVITPPPSAVADVKAEAARRIEAIMPRWMVDREVSGGEAIPEAIKQAVAAIRARSDEIEAMQPIPHDLTQDALWA